MNRLAYLLLFTAGLPLAARGQVVGGMGISDGMKSQVLTTDSGSVRTMANGGKSRDIIHTLLATGEAVAVHESVQPAGAKPNPLHTIQHSEIIVVREGTVVFEHDGLQEKASAGDLIFVRLGTLHTVRNAGDGPAKYVVISIGGDIKQ